MWYSTWQDWGLGWWWVWSSLNSSHYHPVKRPSLHILMGQKGKSNDQRWALRQTQEWKITPGSLRCQVITGCLYRGLSYVEHFTGTGCHTDFCQQTKSYIMSACLRPPFNLQLLPGLKDIEVEGKGFKSISVIGEEICDVPFRWQSDAAVQKWLHSLFQFTKQFIIYLLL